MTRDDLDKLLTLWGAWHVKHMDFQGYPTKCHLYSLRDPHYFNPQHRILCRERPRWVSAIDRIVCRIESANRVALQARYMLAVGRPSERQIAQALGITRAAYRQRLYRARRALLDSVRLAGVM